MGSRWILIVDFRNFEVQRKLPIPYRKETLKLNETKRSGHAKDKPSNRTTSANAHPSAGCYSVSGLPPMVYSLRRRTSSSSSQPLTRTLNNLIHKPMMKMFSPPDSQPNNRTTSADMQPCSSWAYSLRIRTLGQPLTLLHTRMRPLSCPNKKVDNLGIRSWNKEVYFTQLWSTISLKQKCQIPLL